MEGITPDQIMSTVTVLLVLLGGIITVDKAIDIIKKWRTPTTDIAQKLAMDKTRLDEHERAIKDMQEGQQVMCSALLALLDHQLHNGNADQMQSARDDILHYLQGRGNI